MHSRLTALAIPFALLVAIADQANASEPDSVYDIPTHVACLKAPTPECLVDIALENAMLGISQQPPYDMRRVIGMAQLHIGRIQDAISTLRQVVAEKESGGYSPPNPYLVDEYVAVALAEHAAGNKAAADIAFAEALRNTGPARQGYENDTWFSSLLRVSIAQAETGRLDAAERAIAEAKQLAQGLETDPYSGDIWARQDFIGTLQVALGKLAAAQAAAKDFDAALAAARQIGDPTFMRLAGLADRSPDATAGGKGSTFEFMAALSGINNAGVDPGVDVILALIDLASIQVDRGDTNGARQLLTRARELTTGLDNPSFGLAKALSAIAPIQARLADLPGAFETAERVRQLCCQEGVTTVRNPYHYDQTLHEISLVQLATGDGDAAEKTAEKIESPYQRARTLSEIAERAITDKRGNAAEILDAAEEAARDIAHEGAKFEPFTRIAVLRARLGDTDQARDLFDDALESATHVNDGTDVMYAGDDTTRSVEGAIRFVIAGMAEAGDIAGALAEARGQDGISTGAFRDIATAQLERGDLDGAEATVLEGYRRRVGRLKEYGQVPESAGNNDQSVPTMDSDAIAVLGRLAVLRAESGRVDLAHKTVAMAFQAIAPLETQRTGNQTKDHYVRMSWAKALAEIARVQSRIGDAGAARATFARATSAARLIDYLRDRIAVLLVVAEALAHVGLEDEARALLAVAKQDTEELTNNLRPRWVGIDSIEARTALRLIAIQEAELGDMPAALQTVSAIVDPSALTTIGGFARTFQLARETSLREVAAALTKAGRIDDAMRVSDELSIPFLHASLLADIAATSKAGVAGRSPQDLMGEAGRLLEQTDASLSLEKIIAGRGVGYTKLAVSQRANGDSQAAHAALATGHALAKQLPDPAEQIRLLLAIAEAEHAVGDKAAAVQSIGDAIVLADEGLDYRDRLDLYGEIALLQTRVESQVAATETVKRMFGFYYTHLGGTGGTVNASVIFPVKIAELMARLGIDRLDSTSFPPERQ